MKSTKNTNKKTVSMPVEVPKGRFCWDGETICDHFDNEGGHGSCDIGFHLACDYEYLKPQECLNLIDITDE